MADEYENIKKQHLVAYLTFFEEDHPELVFDYNIKLKKISEKEKEHFSNHQGKSIGSSNFVLSLSITDNFIETVKKLFKPSILFPEKWDNLKIEDKEHYIIDEAKYYLKKLVQAINITAQSSCRIIRIDTYQENKLVSVGHKERLKFFSNFDLVCNIPQDFVESINIIFSRILEAEPQSIIIGHEIRDLKKHWWLIALEYFEKYSNFSLVADQTICLTIALESLLSGPDEQGEIGYRIRFRTSLYWYKLANFDPKEIQAIIKAVYDIRSKIVHGTLTLGTTENEKRKIGNNKLSVHQILCIVHEIIRYMLFDIIINQSDKSKNEFIEYIDTIWQTNDPDSLNTWDWEQIKNYLI